MRGGPSRSLSGRRQARRKHRGVSPGAAAAPGTGASPVRRGTPLTAELRLPRRASTLPPQGLMETGQYVRLVRTAREAAAGPFTQCRRRAHRLEALDCLAIRSPHQTLSDRPRQTEKWLERNTPSVVPSRVCLLARRQSKCSTNGEFRCPRTARRAGFKQNLTQIGSSIICAD